MPAPPRVTATPATTLAKARPTIGFYRRRLLAATGCETWLEFLDRQADAARDRQIERDSALRAIEAAHISIVRGVDVSATVERLRRRLAS